MEDCFSVFFLEVGYGSDVTEPFLLLFCLGMTMLRYLLLTHWNDKIECKQQIRIQKSMIESKTKQNKAK